MKNMRNKKSRVLALLLSLCMVMTLLPTMAFAADYDDTDGHWAEAEIDRWTDAGVVHGAGDGEFYPNNNMTRAEAAQVFVNLLKLKTKADLSVYTDAGNGAWYDDALSKVVAAGIMNGTSATTLSPVTTLSREMMFVMIARALGVEEEATSDKTFADGEQTSAWAAGYINALVNMGVINGVDSNHIAPLADINRASVMAALDRLVGGYANTDGQTVEIVPGKVTLIVADNVTVSGKADPDVPIIITGEAGKVDMGKVEGEAVVQVNKSDVAIKNAPVGTEIKAAEDAKNVTANDIDVSKDTDKDVVIPEPSKPGTGGTGGTGTGGGNGGGGYIPPAKKDTTTAATIDGIIETGREAVNKTMKYATIEKFETDKSPREVTVTIYDGTTTVGTVYNNIINTLVDALKSNADKVTSITAVTDINGQSVTEETEGQAYKKTLTLSGSVSNNDVIAFVKALVGTSYNQGTAISGLDGKSFVVEVSDAGRDDVLTTVQYKVTFKVGGLDAVIEKEIPALDQQMDYADLKWNNENSKHTLEVSITNGATQIGTVYNDIGGALCTAFNKVRTTLGSVKDNLANKDESASTLDIEDDIQPNDLVDFIKGLNLKKNGSNDTVKLTTLLSSGRLSSIAGLNGYYFEIAVTPKTGDEQSTNPVIYKIEFTGAVPTLDEVISAQIDDISAKMSYASLNWDGSKHTLTVDISNGDTTIGTVYNDIAGMLCSAFNQTRTTLTSVEDSLNSTEDSEAKLGLDQDLTDTALKAFVSKLYLKKDSETKSLLEVLKGAEQEAAGQSSKISALSGWSFVINVTSNEESAEAVPYTITFSGAPTLDAVIGAEIETIDEKMTYASLDWNADSHTLAVTIDNGETSIGQVYNDIGEALAQAFNKAKSNVSKVEDALNNGEDKASLELNNNITNTTLAGFIPKLHFTHGGSTQALSTYLASASQQGMKAAEISVLAGGQFEINVTGGGDNAQPVKYTISFANTAE